MTEKLSTDYLVIGSGAMGMAFVDTLLDENPDADIIMVDRFAKPGGHWNSAYSFVTLHQPSAFYGVNSRELSKGQRDKTGLNKGLSDLASGAEVLAYFEEVMRHRFLASGRVRYFPMCDYLGNGNFKHKLSGQEYEVASKTLVDCTYLNTSVPSTHRPNFSVDEGVSFIPLNDLPNLSEAPSGYTIIGGGKTGIDAALWLLENHVPPSKIRWIKSRDAWLINRKHTQPDADFFMETVGNQANMMEAIASSTSKSDMFDRLEGCGYFVRIDPNIRPTMFHGATISDLEIEALRQIKDIVRKGRVATITSDHMTFVNGRTEPTLGHVMIDCSATAVTENVIKPIFQGQTITPQTVRAYQPVFSAAMAAWVETHMKGDVEKNSLMSVVPLPDGLDVFIRMTAANMMNQALWSQNKPLRKWIGQSRLDGFSKMVRAVEETETDKLAVLKRLRQFSMPAMEKLQSYM